MAVAQPARILVSDDQPAHITQIAAATTGVIAGQVLDERGQPLDGVVVSAMGGSTSFAVSDRAGQFTLRSLSPGPYLVRAHLDGFLPARNTMVNVRPSSRTVSTFTLRRAGTIETPLVTTAGVGGATISDGSAEKARDESETGWRLRHLKRSILKQTATLAAIEEEDFFLTDSLQLLGRAVGSSARLAGALFAQTPLQGQVNLLTTGALDSSGDLLQIERTRGVAFFSLGAPVGGHGDWTVKAALNQGDLSSWILAGNYVARDPARHRYQFGMSYGVHRYEGGNAAAIVAMPEFARNVGSVYGHDEWRLSDTFSVGYGGHYAHYDYLREPAHFSPRLSVTIRPTESTRVRAIAARHVAAPGAEEFLPPSRAEVLPPQRTFAPLTRDGFAPEDMRHYELAVERVLNGATIGVRAFHQTIDDQLVTIFGGHVTDATTADLGHYVVGNGGDVDVRGVGITLTHAVSKTVRGSFDYSFADADWSNGWSIDRRRLGVLMPSALRSDTERIHDFTTSVETAFPYSATKVFFLYKMNSAYIRADGSETRPGLDGRWDVQLSQGLPFMKFTSADWEMLVAVRNVFRETFTETSVYDELLVARPPKRIVGGITVKF
ncbi:MAG TPA: TonB-dependent receptor [Vicinamibacterales bacterium]|nr:TonB-dependent receptor [Vicinamibacterales bacterium]